MRRFLIILLPLSLLIKFYSSHNPQIVEKFYSADLYKYIVAFQTSLSSLIPFSIAESVLVLLSVGLLYYIIYSLVLIYKGTLQKKKLLKNFIINITAVFSVVYFLFNILWGLNYYRSSFSKTSGLDTNIVTYEELDILCAKLIEETNAARNFVLEDSNGVMKISLDKKYIMASAETGFDIISNSYPLLSGKFGRAKGVNLSLLMSYAGITGFYFPFTGEANVNRMTPNPLLPATICHELSHQRGFAREDESNYIAYLACINHPDKDFKYSGYLLALTNVLGPLKQHDIDAYNKLILKIDPGVKRDINYMYSFWSRYDGLIDKISNRINDLYLKSNNQEYGVESYGRMVDLLILEHKKRASL